MRPETLVMTREDGATDFLLCGTTFVPVGKTGGTVSPTAGWEDLEYRTVECGSICVVIKGIWLFPVIDKFTGCANSYSLTYLSNEQSTIITYLRKSLFTLCTYTCVQLLIVSIV